jgi:hypothetical protein
MPKAFPLDLSPLFLNLNGFVSAAVARAGGVATALWAVGTLGVNPAAGRTAATSTTIFTMVLENNTGAAATAWLEIGGVVITPIYHLNNAETSVVTFDGGMTTGNQDINLNASVNAVVAQLIGIQV